MPRWRQDRTTGELVLVDTGHGGRAPRAPAVHGDIEPFTSPIDGRTIGSRTELRRHNEEFGVVQHREYGEREGAEYFDRAQRERSERMTSQTSRDKRERIDALRHAFDTHNRR